MPKEENKPRKDYITEETWEKIKERQQMKENLGNIEEEREEEREELKEKINKLNKENFKV